MSELQSWVALVGAVATAMLGLFKYFNYRSRKDRLASVGLSFGQIIDSLASADPIRQSAAAILLRRFFDPKTELGVSGGTPYARESVAIIAALLRTLPRGELQKLLADGLAWAPSLSRADLQGCNLVEAFLGESRHPGRRGKADRGGVLDMSGADLFRADLSGASLKGVRAVGTVFVESRATGTVFDDADLTNADFRRSDLADASFVGAKLSGARFSGATNLPPNLEGVVDPDGAVAPNHRRVVKQ